MSYANRKAKLTAAFQEVKKLTSMQSQPLSAPGYPSALLTAKTVLSTLRALVKDHKFNCPPIWVAGGAIPALIKQYPVNDYDVFTTTPIQTRSCFDALAQRVGEDVFKRGYSNDNFTNYYLYGQQIQLITRFSPENMQETIDMFDFTVVSAAYDGTTFVCHPRFYQDLASSSLVNADPDNPFPFVLSTFERVTKYCQRGFSVCPVLLKDLAKQINEMTVDWDNPDEDAFTFYPDGTPRFTGVD